MFLVSPLSDLSLSSFAQKNKENVLPIDIKILLAALIPKNRKLYKIFRPCNTNGCLFLLVCRNKIPYVIDFKKSIQNVTKSEEDFREIFMMQQTVFARSVVTFSIS